MRRVSIKVFFTKTNHFRAIVKEVDSPSYEITIGGKSWNNNEELKYRNIILDKCHKLKDKMEREYYAVQDTRLFEWYDCLWSKILECKFCQHNYNKDKKLSLFLHYDIYSKDLKKVIRDHMTKEHSEILVNYKEM